MKALYAFRDDADFMLTFMGIVPDAYSVAALIEELDEQEKWPESHYALYIDLETFEVIIFDEGDTPEEVGQVCSLTEMLENALQSFYTREAE